MAVVDRLEVIDVRHHEREVAGVAARAGELLLGSREESAPVREPRQRVGGGELAHFRLGRGEAEMLLLELRVDRLEDVVARRFRLRQRALVLGLQALALGFVPDLREQHLVHRALMLLVHLLDARRALGRERRGKVAGAFVDLRHLDQQLAFLVVAADALHQREGAFEELERRARAALRRGMGEVDLGERAQRLHLPEACTGFAGELEARARALERSIDPSQARECARLDREQPRNLGQEAQGAQDRLGAAELLERALVPPERELGVAQEVVQDRV